MSRDWLRQPIAKAGQIDQIVAQHIEARKDSGNKDSDRKPSSKSPPKEPIESPKGDHSHPRSETAPPGVHHHPPAHIRLPYRASLGPGEQNAPPAPAKSPGRVTPPLLTPILDEKPPVPPPREKSAISPRPISLSPTASQPLPVPPDHKHTSTEDPRRTALPVGALSTSPRDTLSMHFRKQPSSGKGLSVSDKRATQGRKTLTRTISYDVQTDEERLQRRQLVRSKSLPCIHTNADPWGLRPPNPVHMHPLK